MKKFFRKKKKDVIAPGTEGLPQHFLDHLLQLELNLEAHWCHENLQLLLEQYRQAVEYYENFGDVRYLQYQRRMQDTLSRPDVKKVLVSERLKEESLQQQSADCESMGIMTVFLTRQKSIKQTSAVKADIQTQENQLQKRLEKRHRRSTSMQGVEEFDKSAGYQKFPSAKQAEEIWEDLASPTIQNHNDN